MSWVLVSSRGAPFLRICPSRPMEARKLTCKDAAFARLANGKPLLAEGLELLFESFIFVAVFELLTRRVSVCDL